MSVKQTCSLVAVIQLTGNFDNRRSAAFFLLPNETALKHNTMPRVQYWEKTAKLYMPDQRIIH
jgi:hypothetical protein